MNFYDIAYSIGLTLASPVWAIKSKSRAKVKLAFAQRMGDVPKRSSTATSVMIHAVSLGEMNATRSLIDALRTSRSDLQFIVSTTTQTGYERGQTLYGSASYVTMIRYPLDFSSAVSRVLERLKPDLVVLMELEIWPNFLKHCSTRKIPVVLANGRITEPSFKRYRLLKPVVALMLKRVRTLCVQDQTYADRFEKLGANPAQIVISGTMKFDTATIADRIDGDTELARAVGLDPASELIWVCGSTGPGEEEIVLNMFSTLKTKYPLLRMAIIPRHPQRFDEVADLITSRGFSVTRRSKPDAPVPDAVILGDTMGELRKFFSLASVVFVGRSLVDLGHRQHGSDMIEPAALGKAIVVGPFTTNFADAMLKFRQADAICEVATEEELRITTDALLSDPVKRESQGRQAQDVVREQQGSTARHAEIILGILKSQNAQNL